MHDNITPESNSCAEGREDYLLVLAKCDMSPASLLTHLVSLCHRFVEDEQTGAERVVARPVGLGVGNTYDVSQTEGAPLPPSQQLINVIDQLERAHSR